jgi:hypothetical protein
MLSAAEGFGVMFDCILRHACRLAFVSLAEATTFVWLWCLFAYPDEWRDPHGYNQLVALMLASFLHMVVFVPLTAVFALGQVSFVLPLLLNLAPIGHMLGSFTPEPVCWAMLVGPSVAIMIAGGCELLGVLTPLMWIEYVPVSRIVVWCGWVMAAGAKAAVTFRSGRVVALVALLLAILLIASWLEWGAVKHAVPRT